MNWIPFISQTGTEVMDISRTTGSLPEIVITNNVSRITGEVKSFFAKNKIPLYCLSSKPSPEEYESLPVKADDLITLNGYLRIIPKAFLLNHKFVFNGHPGDIVNYPELRGFNPQEKAFELQHKVVGSVIHKVTPEVDGGEVIVRKTSPVDNSCVDNYYETLKKLSLACWIEFFKKVEGHEDNIDGITWNR